MHRKLKAQRDMSAAALDNPIGVERLQEIYSRTAAFYDRVVAAQQAKPKQEALAVLARRPGERFLDLGAGTGWTFARLIAESGVARTVGLDLAPGMLEVARDRLRDEAAIKHPPLLLGDGRHLPFADASFDCLLSTYTFEVLPAAEIPSVVRESWRVLRPGGRIVVVNLTEGQDADAAFTADWKRRFAADPEYFGGARPLRLAPLLERQGFIDVSRRYCGPDWPSEVLLAHRP
jgi:ubiquinone/menaquinone biosynthesis C-methylase UbiE